MNLDQAQAALKKYFGYDSFRPMQAEIIESVYAGEDVVVLMPTGGGKSICYQIPALTTEGTCVVVSPLISLMKDQVEALRANGVEAAFLNSTLISAEQRQVEDDLFNGRLQLLYVSPEKITSRDFLPLLQQAKVNLFAIDEAHCISSWGHDFRPEYTRLKFIKEVFPKVPIIALTATADKLTRKDIESQLGLQNPKKFVASFDRPNLGLEVRSGQKRIEQIIAFIRERPDQSGIVYCLSRKNTEDVAAKLLRNGFKADFYHAGMPDRERSRVQEAFIRDEIPIICATVAFGMGIDKSNVRWVIHYNLPKNIESYYQEIGRSGRDGVKADTLLFYSYADLALLRDILGKNESDQTEFKLAKLDRMYQYASAQICRRRMLLSYFGEDRKEDCGNCDVCKNPPQYFEGTVLAQKALSAIARLREQVGVNLLIDVLRGSNRREIYYKNYHKIKTYGAGKDLSYQEWRQYLEQLLNQGLLEVAHDQHNVLKLTPASREVLFDGREVQLVKVETLKKRQEEAKKRAKAKPVRERVRDELFEALRQLRRNLAQQKGVPPYIIFSDATLEEMAANRPATDGEMKEISGVGERKLVLYGDVFLNEIRSFIRQQADQGVKIKGASAVVSYELYREGLSIEAVAQKREMSENTVLGHLAQLYEKGEDIDLDALITAEEKERVLSCLETQEEPYQPGAIFRSLNQEVSYGKIQLALAFYYRQAVE
jgi:ATP-dependent DNA helicase RecQ